MAGSVIDCPICKQPTDLNIIETVAAPAPESLTAPELLALFTAPVTKTRVSFLYQFGLLFVSIFMLLLPVLYLALVGLAGWGVYWWGTHGTFLFSGGGGGRAMILKAILYAAPLFAGIVLVFFMVKPLFARRPKSAQPLALNPGAEPLLFAFIAKICETVGAPFPKRIDLDCNLNAAASFRRGLLSLFGNDLVLTIGLPLVAGLNITQFAGVLAHEFGHFTQGFGMRLTYIIRSVNGWFARVVYERDAWDEMLEEWAEVEDWRLGLVVASARFAVWCSRLVLKVLMYLGHGVGCFMLRQMEFDADSYETKLAGSADFESTSRRIHVLNHVVGQTYKKVRVGWNLSKELPDNFSAYLMRTDTELRDDARTRLEDTMGLEKSGLFDTHPSNGDRIRAARRADEPGVFRCDLPATLLFTNFEVPSKQVTLLHYNDDLEIPPGFARLVPLKPISEPSPEPEPMEEMKAMAGEGPRLRLRK
jgi:Zn-dependent protease with chaperone function